MGVLNQFNRLDRQAWLLLAVSGLFAVSTALSNTFVNVYLWKLKRDFGLIGWFNLLQYAAMAVTFILAGRMAKSVDRVIVIRWGVAVHALFYLCVLLLGDEAARYIYWLGNLLGIGAGLFWLAFNVLYFEITEPGNRDVFNGMNGFLGAAAGIVAPLLSGWIITRVDRLTGYRIVFGLSLAIFLTAVMVSFLLKRRKAEGEYQLVNVLRQSFRMKERWRWVMAASVAQGAREGVYAFLIALLIYVTTQNEMVLGSFLTVSSLMSLIAFLLVGRYLRLQWRDESMLVGTLMMGVVVLPFVWKIKTWSLFVLGVGAAFFYPLYMVPLTSTVFDVIGESRTSARLRIEYVVARELALNLGRVLSLVMFLWWVSRNHDWGQLRWLLLIIGFVQVFAWWALRHVPSVSMEFGTKSGSP
jgi:MFS transporter, YQGE family, putative transporter